MKKLTVIGMLIGILGYSLLWSYYDWKLPLFILIMMFGDNMQKLKK